MTAEGAGDVGVGPAGRTKTVDEALSELRRRLDLRTYLPGERLPAATELAKEIGVSRPAILQALRVLESERRLTVKPGRAGTRVNPFADSREARFASAWQKRSALVEVNSLIDVMEPGVARRLVRRGVDPDALAEAHDINERIRSADDPELLLRHENEFHLHLARATGRKMLEILVLVGRQQISVMHDLIGVDVLRPAHLAADHDRLLAAIAAGDARAAGDLAARHVEDVIDAIADLFDGDELPGPLRGPGAAPAERPTRTTEEQPA